MFLENHFKNTIARKATIKTTKEKLYQALHNLNKWETYLPHVSKIEVIYDDDTYQEFIMHVISEENNLLKVRSVRKCNKKNKINYFQPEPPIFLLHHAGQWEINEVDNDYCELIATHAWNINFEGARKFFSENKEEIIQEKIKSLLSDHANFAMQTWKNAIENGAYQ